jgi:putative FmdB family regulatory protein
MPLYEYACKHCGNFEVMRRISDAPLKKCPTCGARVSKLISLSAFHLKGSGWYATDYAGNGSNKSNDEDSKAEKSTSKDSKASDSSSASSTTSTTPAKEKSAPAKDTSTSSASSSSA